MKQQLYHLTLIFAVVAIVFIPAAFKLSDVQYDLTNLLFGWISDDPNKFSSDSRSLFKLFGVLSVLSIGLFVLLSKTQFWDKNKSKLAVLFKLIIAYYLASRFLVYGFDKVVKSQFFMPEPNTLYTPVGYLSKDILYWTSMGTSYWFNILTGCIEIGAAIMLLFGKTRFTGLLLLTGILVNVLIINIGFDISVKMYSLFLLFLVVLLLSPNLARLMKFLTGQSAQLQQQSKSFDVFYRPFVKTATKFFVVGLMLLDMSLFAIQTGNFNDDLAERPPLHGAYAMEPNSFQIKRCFVHRRGFFILQFQDDSFEDYALEIGETKLSITSYNKEMNEVPYRMYNNVLELNWEETIIKGNTIDWRSLPALADDFHFIEDYRLEIND